jgi:formate/nitrite transporter
MSGPVSMILPPAEVLKKSIQTGKDKATYPIHKFALLSIIAGAYVSLGFSTCLMVGGNLIEAPSNPNKELVNVGYFKLIFGAVGFPFGFTAIVICGGELFTSLCAYMMCSWWEKKTSAWDGIRILVISWVFNFIGCVGVAGLLLSSQVFSNGRDRYTIYLAEEKVENSWIVTFVRGIFANWLVGIATWMSTAAQDLTGKAVGIWLPISAFVMLGFQHCVANMFLLTFAMMLGANISVYQLFVMNLIPSSLGNWIGGAIIVATLYCFSYGEPSFDIEKSRLL